MASVKSCPFCEVKNLTEMVPFKFGTAASIPCKRWLHKDQHCIATLAPEQYTRGHTIVVLKKHRADMTDPALSDKELTDFIKFTKLVANRLKQAARNEEGESPGRIYVCTLCDGVEHLHAHLIPRYPYSAADGNAYEQIFLERDGRKAINRKIEADNLGGYWYIAEREKSYTKSDYWRKTVEERAKYLEELAQHLRISS